MSRATVGVVDYGAGNLASVKAAVHALGFRCRVTSDPELLDTTDVLLLPGVGAFGAAMAELARLNLVDYFRERARTGKPIVGICLGMQLLADSSEEFGLTAGLGLIPGNVVSLKQDSWHIGWNNMEVLSDSECFRHSDGMSFYFNHSYEFRAAPEYRVAVARLRQDEEPVVVAVRRGSMVGLQLHPEKSQFAGRMLLKNVISELCRA
ncbi:imidazole glycerol phosphate synthase subunit HisH [Litorivivens sp.]|uniref:imidazole glycerol phosphate synthase subunit HisH n=1 Tax=Litorivivens sp. TaxID=2020868 RepID=UPI00356A3E7A